MRVVGWPFSATVASAIAFISLIPTSTAAVNQIPNSLIGSGSRSMRRKPLVKYSSRKAMRSKGKFTAAKISRPGVRLKAEIALPGAFVLQTPGQLAPRGAFLSFRASVDMTEEASGEIGHVARNPPVRLGPYVL